MQSLIPGMELSHDFKCFHLVCVDARTVEKESRDFLMSGRFFLHHIFFCGQICVKQSGKDNAKWDQGDPDCFSHKKIAEYSSRYCPEKEIDKHSQMPHQFFAERLFFVM